ncbi:YgcG family protein [Novosphingobium sp. ES2-1]|uniref:TPM domain-containing protein n=1 Tax=Novosphingobium sp. ES2-1 TaxID=2780074 RepID=UPI00188179B7|nr:TPM domain-containing protein [Novosphingobium sp. ES2-1]QOV93352.1 TPM domain-containing protein [Novosphingobium sp. ES2-1]
MTRQLRAFWQTVALLFLLIAGAAHAAMPARPAGPVLDQAGIIPDADEAALAQRLSAYNAQTGRAVIVATVASLDGQDIETYANTLFRTWGVGGKETDQGLLFLIAPNDRKVRIEVGYGLEEFLPDVLAGRIISGAVTPRFKAGDYPGGINAGIDQILTQLNRTPAEAKAVAEAARAGAREDVSGGGSTIGSAIFWVVLIVVMIAVFGRRRKGYVQRRSGIDPGIVLWGISEIARAASDNRHYGGWGGGGGSDWGGGFGGFGGGDSGGGGASGDW